MSEKQSNIFMEVAKKQDDIVKSVIGQNNLQGFQRAHLVASSIGQLKELLTDEYMKPIMELQGTRLGFKTDRDVKKVSGRYVKGDGYPMPIVRDCLIEAVFMGLNPYGNQFNIIGGNMYPTKEGCGYLLNQMPGLKKSIVLSLPKVSHEKKSAAIDAQITWSINGSEEKTTTISIPIKIDDYTSVDAMRGKAERKARAWLLSELTGQEIVDSDLDDRTTQITDVPKKEIQQNPLAERVFTMIDNAKSTSDLEQITSDFEGQGVDFPEECKEAYQMKYLELTPEPNDEQAH